MASDQYHATDKLQAQENFEQSRRLIGSQQKGVGSVDNHDTDDISNKKPGE